MKTSKNNDAGEIDIRMNDADENEGLTREILSCHRCSLGEGRLNAVPGEGPVPARIMLIGEAPGKQEDISGRPFVGRAGSILNEMLGSAGIRREEVFVTSVIKCRPPKNRDPSPGEISACIPYLERQISLVRPEVIVPMGRFAAACILDMFGLHAGTIGTTHGKLFLPKRQGYSPVIIPVYHPAVITHNPRLKEALKEDFQAIKRHLHPGEN
jgi:uracil-DNA glycosylase, family 4